ncbi:hypothetical protein [Chthoniobacter sp.]|uniref:hypothetical protein n=1 Tax=Chthoniobacter sp. TaxID=2510640 RepID=UPI0032AEC724
MFLLVLAVVANTAELKAPATFLPPPNDHLRHVLETPVSGDFHAADIREVFGNLFGQLRINLIFKREKKAPPTFTGNFDRVPFRAALFRILQSTGYTAEWTTRPDGAQVISIHD